MTNKASMEEMIQLFSDELVLCKVGPGEKVAVLSEGNNLQDYAEAFVRGQLDASGPAKQLRPPHRRCPCTLCMKYSEGFASRC